MSVHPPKVVGSTQYTEPRQTSPSPVQSVVSVQAGGIHTSIPAPKSLHSKLVAPL